MKENIIKDTPVKVKIIKCSSPFYWYEGNVGETFEVEQCRFFTADWSCVGRLGSMEKADCEIITDKQSLQEQLQAAKDNVVAIEAQMAAIAEEEANRPFTQEAYERVVAQLRKCAGRKVFVDGEDNYVLEMTITSTHTQSWTTYMTVAPFGVFFKSHDACKDALKEVGEANLRKAWLFEMSIGLEETV